MKIALAYNLRTEETPEQAERYRREEVDRLVDALEELDHEVVELEVSGRPGDIVDRLIETRPELVFNVAEGKEALGPGREAYCPALFEQMSIPYTGSGPSLLQVDLDKRLTEKLMSAHGINVPRGVVLTSDQPELPEDMPLPLFIKPNYEGTSKGIYQDSVVEDRDDAQKLVNELLEKFPDGIEVEQFIRGREITVPFLEEIDEKLLDIVEHDFSGARGEHDIYDYELKQTDEGVEMVCPADLEYDEKNSILEASQRALEIMPCHDLGRVDFRLAEDGTPYFLEVNPLPRLMPDGSLTIAAKKRGMDYPQIMDCVIRSASKRYGLTPTSRTTVEGTQAPGAGGEDQKRGDCREMGINVGRFQRGRWNAITDVEGIHVGHVSHEEDDVPDPVEPEETSCVRTGITAVVPEFTDLFNNHLVSGGFVLNGVGDVSGMTQAMEWGWLETPILLTNTMSLGHVHSGVIRHLIKKHPELGRKIDVVIPVVAETDDSFLNDVRIPSNTADDTVKVIENATGGPVEQGSVGGGTGMITFDFAGGIGSSSRRVPGEESEYTIGVLVQSNFGKMRNLTVDGAVVGRELNTLFPQDIRQGEIYGSIIVVVATDAPLLTAQLNRLAKRAALGLGRVGSFAASTSGEIVFAFSTANRSSREAKEQSATLNLEFVSDPHINPLYEATVECTEEAVLNSMFCSNGQTGRMGRYAPACPIDRIKQMLHSR
ncbi:MAG: P1 family peptidase [Phycisphaerae bacterium]